EFDSSAKHGGAPLKRPANQLIRGWTEALQMMKVGSKWELYLPAALAYGEGGTPTIPPGSTLIFEMDLQGVEAPHAPAMAQAHPQPLTSDIIKVPSAEELKKGAKIEVIKPEDVAKHAAEESGKAKQ
ncbi:MAG: FKBP-type peptidyl-prolyl cis-trans isomerase, partial [Limisphaerales bacterium]